MNSARIRFEPLVMALLCIVAVSCAGTPIAGDSGQKPRRLLYVAQPGIRDYVQYGGHGVIVFDIDDGHRFVKRIPMGGRNEQGKPLNVKGVCASAITDRLYVSTLRHLICIDLSTDEQLWERNYDKGCDRMAISPDGKTIYLPTLERDHWKVLNALTGDVIARVSPDSRAHNTVYGPNGREAYLAGLGSDLLTVADATIHKATRTVGPFSGSVRPFTVNGSQTRVYACVNGRLGFEVGDLKTGKVLHEVDVQGFEKGKVKRHGCPSHGIGVTPDGTRLWLSDGANSHMHIFDLTSEPPEQIASVKLRGQPGWVTFSIDGTLAYPSTGDVIDTKTLEVIAQLTDEKGRMVMSEKLLEIDFVDNDAVRAGDQFGIGKMAESIE